MSERGGQDAGEHAAVPLVARLVPWAVLPVPLLLATIIGLWFLDVHSSYESRSLLTILNFTLVTCTSAVIALLAGRTFLATGAPGVLFLGAGVLLMGASFTAAPLAGMRAPNVTATVHNLGMLAAGILSLIGAWLSYRPRAPLRAPGPATLAAYVGAVAFVGGTTYFALGGVTPPFFVQGAGGTPLRQVVLASSVGLFGAASLVLALAQGNATTFRRWYALGLALLGVGLLGVMFQENLGSPISWVGRISQYLGSVYLLVASMTSATEARRWGLPLEAELREVKTQAQLLRETKDQLARVLEGSNDGFWDWNLQNGQVDFSDRWAEMFGYRRSELAPSVSTWQGMVHPDDREEARAAQQRIARGETDRYEVDRRLRHKDGHWVWVHVRGKVVERDRDGKATRMAGTYTDISARKAAEEQLRRSQQRLADVLEGSSDGYWERDLLTGKVTLSARASMILGNPAIEKVEEVPEWGALLHPDDRRRVAPDYEAAVTGVEPRVDTPLRIRHADGSWRWIRLRGTVTRRDGTGKPTRMSGTITDIDEGMVAQETLSRAQEELRDREAKLAAVFASPAAGIAITSPEKGWLEVNDEICSMLGYSREELAQRTWLELTHPDDVAVDVAEFKRLLAGEIDRYAIDKRFVRRDGATVWTLLSVSCVRRDDGSVGFLVAVLKDITRRKEAEDDLGKSRDEAQRRARELQAVLDAVPAAIYITRDPSALHMETNRFGADLMKVPPDANVSRSAPEDQRNRTIKVMKDGLELPTRSLPVQVAAAQGIEVRNDEFDLVVDGEPVRHLLGNARPIFDESGAAAGAVGAFIDVTPIREAEARARESEARYRALADEAPVGIYETDANGGIVYVNAMARSLLGQTADDAKGMGALPAIHPGDRERVRSAWLDAVAAGNRYQSEHRFLRRDGSVVTVNVVSSPIRDRFEQVKGYVGVMVDVTESKAMQARLAETSRLAALGTLVAGLAHEINNPLAAKMTSQGLALEVARAAREQLRAGAPIDPAANIRDLDGVIEALEDAEQAGQRIARIVRDMALFARPDAAHTRVELRSVVDDALRWVPKALATMGDMEVEDHGSPDVMASAGQLSQVVQNLLTNALRATRPGTRGKILIRLGTGDTGRAILEVVDQGAGISPANLGRVFDPFFTTRPVGEGRGAGLGLAVCHSIVTAHGGTATVESEVGKGSTFRVELPAAPAEA